MIDETELGADISESGGEEYNEEKDGSDSFRQPREITHEEVMEIWGITESKLKLVITQHDLPAYERRFKVRRKADPVFLQSVGPFELQSLYFMSDDIEEFEREHPELFPKTNPKDKTNEQKLRPDQRHRERCRALAQNEWLKHPDTTIAEMIKWEQVLKIGCEGKQYKPKTLHGWIKDLCPNRRPGRRPKD